MKVSFNWLKSYLDIDLPIEKVSEILTDIGLEVEGIDTFESIKGGLKGIVIGKVLTKEKHPDADKLSVTTVDLGEVNPVQIVCGAPNVDAGQTVAVATVGSTLYDEDKSFKIKKSKIRGVESHGMICAEDELGLGTSHDGIMILPNSLIAGTNASEHFEVENDTIFEIGLTPNRSDATSQIGVAKDLGAYIRVHLDKNAKVKLPTADYKKATLKKEIQVEVKDFEKCPRYAGVVITGIEIEESPSWIKNRLTAIGVRPINNIVDITNFVLHEYGQPLHAFDYEKINNQKVIVQSLPKDTSFTTLDETKRKLHEEDLLICDGQDEPMCLAGVFGGLESGVSDNTTTIFLESAHFHAINTRKSSTRHLLRTDAAKCFEKGSDPNIVITALERAISLIEEYGNGEVASDLIDIYPTPIQSAPIKVSKKNISRLLGVSIPENEIITILNALEISIEENNTESYTVKVPTNKADVTREADVIEEILRIYGFNNIPIPTTIKSAITVSPAIDNYAIRNKIADHLSAKGYNEIMAMSITKSIHVKEAVENLKEEDCIYINNTSSVDLDIMRPTLLFGALESLERNINRQHPNLKLYEFGTQYKKQEDNYKEVETLAITLTGNSTNENWETKAKGYSFYDLKAIVDNVLESLGLSVSEITAFSSEDYFQYGVSIKNYVRLGKIKGAVSKHFSVEQDVFFAEFNWKSIIKAASKAKTLYKSISKFPFVRRDLALVIDQSISFQNVKTIAEKSIKGVLKDVNLFDIFESEEHLGKGKKSYSVSYIFQDQKKTLKDKDVDKFMTRLISTYEKEVGALIRK